MKLSNILKKKEILNIFNSSQQIFFIQIIKTNPLILNGFLNQYGFQKKHIKTSVLQKILRPTKFNTLLNNIYSETIIIYLKTIKHQYDLSQILKLPPELTILGLKLYNNIYTNNELYTTCNLTTMRPNFYGKNKTSINKILLIKNVCQQTIKFLMFLKIKI